MSGYRVVSYMKCIPPGNKKAQKPLIIRNFIEGVNRAGKKFDYLNFNYVILAQIVEIVSKQSFEEYLKANVFDTAGMKDAFVFNANDNSSILKKKVFGHIYRRTHPLDYQDLKRLYYHQIG